MAWLGSKSDKFVDEIRQTLAACAVFALIPIFTLSDGGIGNAVNSMSGAMTLNGVPNDLIDNFNPLAIIIFARFSIGPPRR
jgi:POT family proton-dependent oligopeptide transporter